MKQLFLFALLLAFSLSAWLSSPLAAQSTQLDTLWITNFERGESPLDSGVQLVDWQHDERLLEIKTGFHAFSPPDPRGGAYAAKASFEPTRRSVRGWSGGGIVVEFPSKDVISGYEDAWLEFDLRAATAEDNLRDLRVKLESEGGCHSAELRLSDYGFSPTANWTHVKIPVAEFFHHRCEQKNQSFDLAAVNKFVTVNVREAENPGLKGSLLIDNLFFTLEKKIIVYPDTPRISTFRIKEFSFSDLPVAQICREGDPITIHGTYKADVADIYPLYAFLLLVDEHLTGFYLQTRVIFRENGTWESRIYPGNLIKGIVAFEATRKGYAKFEDLKFTKITKVPQSTFYTSDFKTIREQYFPK